MLNFKIDKITNSIENTITGEVFDTIISVITKKDTNQILKNNWLFDWTLELTNRDKEVYKLTTRNNPAIIQGLLSIEDKMDHVFIHLLESAKFNKGKRKLYLGVPGNLVAFACKISFERGYEGFVAFDAKTKLIDHYRETLGASVFRGQRMFIRTEAALKLIRNYFGVKNGYD